MAWMSEEGRRARTCFLFPALNLHEPDSFSLEQETPWIKEYIQTEGTKRMKEKTGGITPVDTQNVKSGEVQGWGMANTYRVSKDEIPNNSSSRKLFGQKKGEEEKRREKLSSGSILISSLVKFIQSSLLLSSLALRFCESRTSSFLRIPMSD